MMKFTVLKVQNNCKWSYWIISRWSLFQHFIY